MLDIRKYFDRLYKLNDQEWQEMQKAFNRVEVSKKQILLNEGEVCDFIAFIEDGLFRFYFNKDGVEKVTAFWFPGDFLSNYRSFLSGRPSNHVIEVMEAGVIWQMQKKDLYKLYDRYPNIQRLGRLMAEQLYLMVAERLDNFVQDTPEERYLTLLKKSTRMIQEIPQYMIASYLGVSAESLSRIRKRISQ